MGRWMKKHLVMGFFIFALIGFLAVGSAQAQDTGKIGVFAGYSYGNSGLGANSNNCAFSWNCTSGSLGLHGYTLAVTYKLNKTIAFEANLAGHNGGGGTSY